MSHEKKVIVTADESGAVIIISENNPAWGHIRVTQKRVIVDEKGFAKAKTMSALIPGELADLKAFGYVKNQEIEGRVIVKESLTPFNPKEPERDLKIAGKTGIICTLDGQPIYRKTFYTENLSARDVRIQHTNGEDIKIAYDQLKIEEENEGNKESSTHSESNLDLS